MKNFIFLTFSKKTLKMTPNKDRVEISVYGVLDFEQKKKDAYDNVLCGIILNFWGVWVRLSLPDKLEKKMYLLDISARADQNHL